MGRIANATTEPDERDGIAITEKMREAGAAVLLGYFGGEDASLADGELAASVFRAMYLVRDLELEPP